VHIDPAVREFLMTLTDLRTMHRPVRWLGRFNVFVTTGFLPERFREEMALPWDDERQRRFERMIGAVRRVDRVLPTPLRAFPFNALLVDMRWRMRTGRRLV
jgi:uncharacterized protein (DUF2236 family)